MAAFVTFVWRSLSNAYGIASVVTFAASLLFVAQDELPRIRKLIEWVPTDFQLSHLLWISAGFLFLGSASAWGALWKEYVNVTTRKPMGDARPEEVLVYLLRDTAWGFGRIFDINRRSDFEEAIHDAAANGVIGLWGRPTRLSPHRRPLAPIPPEHITHHRLHLMGSFGGPNDLLELTGSGATHKDLHFNWWQVKAWHPPLASPVRAFRRLQWALFHVDMMSRPLAKAAWRVAVVLRVVPHEFRNRKKKKDEEAARPPGVAGGGQILP